MGFKDTVDVPGERHIAAALIECIKTVGSEGDASKDGLGHSVVINGIP